MWCRLFAALSLFSAVVGCGGAGSPRQGIYGKVTVDSQPLATGVITFKPAEGTMGPVVGASIANGKYRLSAGEGPVLGDYRVEISSTKKGDQKVVVVPGEEPGYMAIETIPPQYNKKSTLTAKIEKGNNEQDFELSSAAAKP
ncbi:MAG: hypothetical protein KDA72_00010 [Planctomycetales bacterium]|nr:hypothetical protein [Planctomycetales bacterium]